MAWIAILLTCALTLATPASAAERVTAITQVTVLDGRGGAPIQGATVIIQGDTIRAVRTGPVRVPRNAEVIDGRGQFLLPGFIDMHAHLLVPRCEPPAGQSSPFDRALSERMLQMLLAYGITTVRSPANPTEAGLALRDDLNAGRVAGPRALAAAELINNARMTESQLRDYVRSALRYRPDYFKVYARLTPDQVAVVVDEAHAAGVPVIGHLQATSWAEGARLGLDHLTHAADWSEKTLQADRRAAYRAAMAEKGPMRARLDWLEALDPDGPEVSRMIDEIKSRGVSVDPTLVAYDSKFSDPAAARYRQNPAANAIPELRADWEACGDATGDWTGVDRRRWERLSPKLGALVRRMHAAGVLLTTGSDLTNEWIIPGESLHQEFELLREAGLPPAAILRMTGENAARALRRDDIGVVAAGRRADLVLLSANPLEDIRNTRRQVWVMQGGRRIPSATR